MRIFFLLVGAALAALPPGAFPQEFPTKPVRIHIFM